jgi:hypothetical protein
MADSAISKFIKENFKTAGGLAQTGLIGAVSLATTDSKLKALLKTLKELALIKFTWAAAQSRALSGLGSVVRGLVKDTGSLQAALNRLNSIQGLTRTFASLTGGMDAARKKVNELLKLSGGQGKAFSFEQWGRAAQSLQVFTRGSYSGLKQLGDAAAATNNNLTDVTDAVSEVYDALRSGEPIGSATEKLRQMGIVSADEADQLQNMADHGEDASRVFSKLTDIIEKHNGGMDALNGTVEAAMANYSKAGEALKEAVGSAFTDEEVDNLQNWADTMDSLAPAAKRTASFLAMLVDGFSTAVSAASKWAASNQVIVSGLEVVIKGVGMLAVGMTALGVVTIPAAVSAFNALAAALTTGATAKLIAFGVQAATAEKVMGGLLLGIRGLTIGAGGLLMAGGLATLIGAYINFKEGLYKTSEEAANFKNALDQGTDSIRQQVLAIQTLTDKNEALKKAIQGVIEAGEEQRKLANPASNYGFLDYLSDQILGTDKLGDYNFKRIAADNATTERMALVRAAKLKKNSTLSPGAEGMSVMGIGGASRMQLEDATYQAQLQSSNGVTRILAMQDRMRVLKEREQMARIGLQDRADKAIGVGTPTPGTSTHAMMMAGRTSGRARANWEYYANQQRELEDSMPSLQSGIVSQAQQIAAALRAQVISSISSSNEIGSQSAKLSGNNSALRRLANQDTFLSKFEELRAFMPEDQARDRAMEFANNSISLRANDAFLSASQAAKVSSLQAIGGGGNIGPGAGDPMLSVAKDQKQLLQDAVNLLNQIAKASGGGTVEP